MKNKEELIIKAEEKTNKNISWIKKKKILKIIIEWLIYIILFFLIVWGTPKGLTMILHTDFPIASITSSSMWPELKKGDIVFIKGATSKEEIGIGNIVVFKNNNAKQVKSSMESFTIHRIVRLNENNFIAKGDANNTDDAPVSYDRLIGKAVEFRNKTFRIPYLGKLSQIFNK